LTSTNLDREDTNKFESQSKKTKKKDKLVTALDKVLEHGTDDIDEDTLLLCRKLRKSLETSKEILSEPSESTSTALSSHKSSISDLSTILTPWTAASIPQAGSVPPLPNIQDAEMRRAAFIHHGVSTHADPASYERLEWFGDAYIYLLSTHFIYHTFPHLTPGKMAQLRERCVKNETLAGYSHVYHFGKQANLPPELNQLIGSSKKAQTLEKVYGDIFEAYVGAVILSNLQNGVAEVAEWLKVLWAGTLAHDIKAQDRRNATTPSSMLSTTSITSSSGTPSKPLSSNPKDALVQAIGSKGIAIYYEEYAEPVKDRDNGLPRYRMAVYVDIDDSIISGQSWDGTKNGYTTKVVKRRLETGSGLSKKDASFNAAEKVLANKRLVRDFGKRKEKVMEAIEKEKALKRN
jgi:ribonuclease-3